MGGRRLSRRNGSSAPRLTVSGDGGLHLGRLPGGGQFLQPSLSLKTPRAVPLVAQQRLHAVLKAPSRTFATSPSSAGAATAAFGTASSSSSVTTARAGTGCYAPGAPAQNPPRGTDLLRRVRRGV
jgi:hypothetical protein